jgi:hypothetical protein
MTFSEIYNKPTSIQSEDLLTSDIFGCCSFLQYDDLMKYVLGEAIHFTLHTNFERLETVIRDTYYFWPRFQTGNRQTEPDLFVVLWHSDKDCSLVLIESKYNSGKSSEASDSDEEITDQLARELSIIESKEIYTQIPELIDANIISNTLFYVTADDIIPRKSMKMSAKEYFNKTNNYRSIEEIPIYWLPWWKIENFSRKLISNQNNVNKHRVIKHVWEVLTYKKLSRYNGLGQLILNPISFGYISDHKEHIRDYNYDANFVSIPYKYQKPSN